MSLNSAESGLIGHNYIYYHRPLKTTENQWRAVCVVHLTTFAAVIYANILSTKKCLLIRHGVALSMTVIPA